MCLLLLWLFLPSSLFLCSSVFCSSFFLVVVLSLVETRLSSDRDMLVSRAAGVGFFSCWTDVLYFLLVAEPGNGYILHPSRAKPGWWPPQAAQHRKVAQSVSLLWFPAQQVQTINTALQTAEWWSVLLVSKASRNFGVVGLNPDHLRTHEYNHLWAIRHCPPNDSNFGIRLFLDVNQHPGPWAYQMHDLQWGEPVLDERWLLCRIRDASEICLQPYNCNILEVAHQWTMLVIDIATDVAISFVSYLMYSFTQSISKFIKKLFRTYMSSCLGS